MLAMSSDPVRIPSSVISICKLLLVMCQSDCDVRFFASVANVGPLKSVYKTGTSSNKAAKGLPSVSPVSSPLEQAVTGSAISPFATGILSKGDSTHEEITPPLDVNKEHIDIGNFDQEIPSKSAYDAKPNAGRLKGGHLGDQPLDLQSSHPRIVSESSKGTNLKVKVLLLSHDEFFMRNRFQPSTSLLDD